MSNDTIDFNNPKASINFKKFDKSNVGDAVKILEEYFKKIQSETGLKLSLKGGRYTDFSFTTKLEVEISSSATSDPDEVTKKQKDLWNKFHSSYGFEKEWLGKTVSISGESYRIIGLNIRKPKYCVILYSYSKNTTVGCSQETLKAYKNSIH
jgi:hypothetical protein